MLYHNSPTTKNIQLLKRLRAAAMKQHLDAMAQLTILYKPIIDELVELRHIELDIEAAKPRVSNIDYMALCAKLTKKQCKLAEKVQQFILLLSNH